MTRPYSSKILSRRRLNASGVRGQFLRRVSDSRVQVVAVNLDDCAGSVDERECAINMVWSAEDCRLDSNILQRNLKESIEIRGQNHPDVTQLHEVSNGSVSLCWDLGSLFSLLLGGLPVGS